METTENKITHHHNLNDEDRKRISEKDYANSYKEILLHHAPEFWEEIDSYAFVIFGRRIKSDKMTLNIISGGSPYLFIHLEDLISQILKVTKENNGILKSFSDDEIKKFILENFKSEYK